MAKNILIIGASSGIGFELAKNLLAKGHNVYCGARRENKLDKLKALGAKTFVTDVRSEESVKRIVDEMVQRESIIDVVYINAGIAIAGPVEETSIDKVNKQFNTNVFGPARVLRAVLPIMRKQEFGRIVFTTSIASRVSTGMNSWYSSSKHALNGMVKGLAQELAPFNIKVVTVEPGCVQTELDAMQLADMKNTNKLEDYRVATKKSHDFLYDAYRKGASTESTVDVMIKAGFTASPKLSYRTTKDAKALYFLQKLFGEQMVGKIMNKLVLRF